MTVERREIARFGVVPWTVERNYHNGRYARWFIYCDGELAGARDTILGAKWFAWRMMGWRR